MDEFRLLQIQVIEIKEESETVSDFSSLSVKAINGTSIVSSTYPFTLIFLPLSKFYPDPELIFFESLEEKKRFPIGISTLKLNSPSQIEVLCCAKKIQIMLTLSAGPEIIFPENFLEKYKESVNDIPRLKSLLLESLQEVSSEIGTAACHELALDLNFFKSTEPISHYQAEHFKDIILGLNEKLKILHITEIILQATSEKSKLDLIAREKMQKNTENAWGQMLVQKLDQTRLIENIQKKLNFLQIELNQEIEKNREFQNTIIELNGEKKILEGEKTELKSELKNFADMEKMIQDYRSEIKDLEKSRDKMREDFRQLQREHDELIEKKDKELEIVIGQNSELEKELEVRQSEIFSLKNVISSHESLIEKQNSHIESHLAEIKAFKDQEGKAASMEALAKKHHEECIKSHENMQKTTSKFSEVVKNINQEKIKLLKASCELQSTIKKLTDSSQILQEKLNLESISCKDLRSQNEAFQATIYLSVDSQHISRQLLKLYSGFTKSKQVFVVDSSILSKIILQMSLDLLNSFRFAQQIVKLIETRDEEIAILKDLITELQKKIPYIPAKNDPVDFAMAEYVNSLPEPMEIPFVREDPGIYLFGSKRIYVKLDNDKLSSKKYLVRVGGGSILLDEYVESYGPNELNKMIERRRKQSASGKKNVMGKILEKISNF